jgi:hypothetical protein
MFGHHLIVIRRDDTRVRAYWYIPTQPAGGTNDRCFSRGDTASRGRRSPSAVAELSGDAWQAFLCMEEVEQEALIVAGLPLKVISQAIMRSDEKRKYGPIPIDGASIYAAARNAFGDFGPRVEARIYIPNWIKRTIEVFKVLKGKELRDIWRTTRDVVCIATKVDTTLGEGGDEGVQI